MRTVSLDSRRGHTLVELVVVAMLLALVSSLASRAWQPMSQNILDLKDRASTATEMKVAVEFLRDDLGAAKSAARISSSKGLEIVREDALAFLGGWTTGKGDPGVVYFLENGALVREDKASKTKIAVARDVSEFAVEPVKPKKGKKKSGDLQIVVKIGSGKEARQCTLIWTA